MERGPNFVEELAVVPFFVTSVADTS